MTTSPSFERTELLDPIPYSEVEGTYPNPEEYIKTELNRIFLEMQVRLQAEDQAIVAYFNEQLRQVSALINGLAGGEDLQAALETLENLRSIVDADGNGILDALGPINRELASLHQGQDNLTQTQELLISEQESLQSTLNIIQQIMGNLGTGLTAVESEATKNKNALLAVANNMGRNMQAIRNALASVNVDFTPIELPDPVFATTNVGTNTGGSDPSAV